MFSLDLPDFAFDMPLTPLGETVRTIVVVDVERKGLDCGESLDWHSTLPKVLGHYTGSRVLAYDHHAGQDEPSCTTCWAPEDMPTVSRTMKGAHHIGDHNPCSFHACLTYNHGMRPVLSYFLSWKLEERLRALDSIRSFTGILQLSSPLSLNPPHPSGCWGPSTRDMPFTGILYLAESPPPSSFLSSLPLHGSVVQWASL